METLQNNRINISLAVIVLAVLTGISMFFISPLTTVKIIAAAIAIVLTVTKPIYGLYIVILAIPFMTQMNELIIVFVLVICISYLLSLLLNKELKFVSTPLNLPIFVFMLVEIFATLHSASIKLSLRNLSVDLVSFCLFFVIVNVVNTKKKLNIIIKVFVLITFLLACFGIIQYFVIKPMDVLWADKSINPELNARAVGTFSNPNIFAEYLEHMLPVAVALIFTVKKLSKRILHIIISSAIIICLVLTFSRASYLGFAAAIFVLFVVKFAKYIPLAITAVIVSIPIALKTLPGVILDRITSIGSLKDSSNAYRVDIWQGTVNMIKDFWITGVGFGYWAYKNAFMEYAVRATKPWHSHNLYLEIMAEIGVFGMLAFIWIVVMLFTSVISFSRKTKDRYLSWVSVGLLCSVVSLLVHGVAEHVLYMPISIIMFWMIIALAMCTRNIGCDLVDKC